MDDYYPYQVQESLQNQASEQQQMNYAMQMRDDIQQQQAVLVEQTNPRKIVEDIILRLMGAEKQGDKIIQVAEPKMNKIGIDAMWFWLNSHINQNTILSHYEQKEINNFLQQLGDDLVDELSLKWKVYGIKSKPDLDTINDSILGNIKSALNRAKGQNEKNWLGKISFENVNPTKMPTPKKESFLSNFRL